MPILNDKEYECDLCHGVFAFVVDRKVMEEEYRGNFPISAKAQVEKDIVCDDCYKIVTEQLGFPEK